jgi:hypothetical protein
LFVLRFPRLATAQVACIALYAAACEGDVHKEIYGNIHVVVNRNDSFLAPAVAELERYGTRALPQIETALHSATPQGRVRLVQVMARIERTETVPLLRHLGLFDADGSVRKLAKDTLLVWGARTQDVALSTASNTALAWVHDQSVNGLGPMVRAVP